MKKLRLLLFEDCNRTCEGCCNKDWNMDLLEKENDFSSYDIIMLTGGEPMLMPNIVIDCISDIRKQTNADIYMYTAKTDNVLVFLDVLSLLDGVTVTLHQQKDVDKWVYLSECISRAGLKNKSLRVNVFKDIVAPQIGGWIVKENIEWIKDCPLPENETFKRM